MLPVSAPREPDSNSIAMLFSFFKKFIYASVSNHYSVSRLRAKIFVLFMNAALVPCTKIRLEMPWLQL